MNTILSFGDATGARRSGSRIVLRVLVILAVVAAALLAATSALLVNPTVPQGGTGRFWNTGLEDPVSGTWEIRNSANALVANNTTPNGWTCYIITEDVIGNTSGQFVLTAPYSAVIATNYKVRYYHCFRMQVGYKSASALFDVVAGPPPPPSNLTATAVGYTQVNLHWTDNSSNETGFKVQRMTLPSGTWTQVATPGANATSCSDSLNLSANTSYAYQVCAYNANGNSPWSNTANATTSPVTPTGLTATPGNQQVTLNWTTSPGATSYNVKWSNTAGGPYTTITPPVTTTSYVHSGLTNGTRYYYVVSASNGTESPNSSEVSAVPDTVPNAPSDVAVTVLNSTMATVEWTDNSSNETQFNVQRRPVGGTWGDIGSSQANITYFDDSGLNSNTTYQYRVCAANAIGSSAWVQASDATTPLVDKPLYLSAFATSSTSIRVYWTKVDGATSYRVYRGTSPGVVPNGSPIATVTPTTDKTQYFDDAGLTTNQDYYYIVTTMQGTNESAASNEDYHFPSTAAIPWHLSATDILAAVKARAQGLFGNPVSIGGGVTYILEPGGGLMNDITNVLQPNPASWSPLNGRLMYGTYEFPSFTDWYYGFGSGGATGPLPKIKAEGAYKKSVAIPSAALFASVVGASCTYYLPDSTDSYSFGVNQPTYESPHAYLGFDCDGPSVEGGVQWCPAKTVDGVAHPDRWQALLRISDGRKNGYSDRVLPRYLTLLENCPLAVKCLAFMFGPNNLPSHGMYGMGTSVTEVLAVDLPTKTVFFNAFGGDINPFTYVQSYAIPMRFDYDVLQGQRALRNPRMRRVVALAQTESHITNPIRFTNRPPENSWPNAYGATGSWYKNVGFGDGLLWSDSGSDSWLSPAYWLLTPGAYAAQPCASYRYLGGIEYVDIQH